MTAHLRILTCPCCGGPIASPPDPGSLVNGRMSEQQKVIVGALVKAFPLSVRVERLVTILYADDRDGGPDDPNQVIRAQIVRIRRVLETFGWTIPKAKTGRGNYGEYRLEKVR